MKIILEFTEEEMKNPTLMREAILNLFGTPILREDIGQPIEEVRQPINTCNNRNRIDIVEELEEFQKKIFPTLTDKQQKSMKRFVEFYKKKILENDFKIQNFNKVWEKWWSSDKNK